MWGGLLVGILFPTVPTPPTSTLRGRDSAEGRTHGRVSTTAVNAASEGRGLIPSFYQVEETIIEPPSLAEIERNLTVYLRTLHAAFSKLQGVKAIPIDIWETYVDVTKNTVMKWDDENKHRFPKPRKDESIFVSLGTYRGKYFARI